MFKNFRTILLALVLIGFIGGCDKAANTNEATEVKNKELYLKTMDAFKTGNPDLLNDVLDDAFVEHNPDPSVPGTGKQHWKNQVVEYKKTFPDMTPKVEHILAHGDMVWAHFRIKGTNSGPMGGMPATGKSVDVEGIEIMRFKDGKAVERWGVFDAMTMMTQLGLIPTPGSEQAPAQP